jgi:hypothetical protein
MGVVNLVVILCCLWVVSGQSMTSARQRLMQPTPTPLICKAPDEWEFSLHSYPNPQNQKLCPNCSTTEQSWVCDPNSRYPADEREKVLSAVSAVNDTVCTCNGGQCIQFSVAVLSKFKVLNNDEYDEKMMKYGSDRLTEWMAKGTYCGGIMLFVSAENNKAELIVRNVNMTTCEKAANITSSLYDIINQYKQNAISLTQLTQRVAEQYRLRCDGGSGSSVGLIIGIIVIVLLIIVAIIVTVYIWYRQKKNKQSQKQAPDAQHLRAPQPV